jgi:hypothetical protein
MTRLVFFAALMLLPSAAFGQDHTPRWEVFGTIGAATTLDDEGGRGKGVDLGGGFGVRATRRIGLEVAINRIHHKREFSFSGVLFEGTGTFMTGNVIYYFSDSRAQPYVTGGAGFIRHEDRSRIGPGPAPPAIAANGFACNVGVGVKAFITRHVSLRPEFRVFGGYPRNGGVEPPFGVFRGSISLGYHW